MLSSAIAGRQWPHVRCYQAGWTEHEDQDGNLYFYNTATDHSTREHPLDKHYRQTYLNEKRKKDQLKGATEDTAEEKTAGKGLGGLFSRNKGEAAPAVPAGRRLRSGERADARDRLLDVVASRLVAPSLSADSSGIVPRAPATLVVVRHAAPILVDVRTPRVSAASGLRLNELGERDRRAPFAALA